MTGSVSGETGGYEVTQPSATYNQLITSKIETQTRISRIQETINKFEKEITEIEARGETQDPAHYATLQEQFNVLDERINGILDITRETAVDYFKSDRFSHAFQVLDPAVSRPLLVQVIRNALLPGVGVEAVVFGAYVLSAVCTAARSRKREETLPASEAALADT